MGPWQDAMNRGIPGYKPQFGPSSWNTKSYVDPKYGMLKDLFGQIGGMFGGQGAGAGAGGAGGQGAGGGFNVQTPYIPAPIYDPTSLQVARNQMRAQVPTALGSAARSTGAGVSGTLGHQGDIYGQQQAGRMAGEEETQQAMLQADLANAQNMLAGQQGAYQSALGLAGGQMDRMGMDQRLRYGLAGQGLTRGNLGSNFLMDLLNYL